MILKILNKKFLTITALFIAIYFMWCNIAPFNVNKATRHLTENALSRSHNCCAWFVMRAMQSGGCPSIILPAWAYRYYLPTVGWK